MYRWANLRANVAAVARSGPTECVAFFGNAVSSMTNTASAPPTSLSAGLQSHAPMALRLFPPKKRWSWVIVARHHPLRHPPDALAIARSEQPRHENRHWPQFRDQLQNQLHSWNSDFGRLECDVAAVIDETSPPPYQPVDEVPVFQFRVGSAATMTIAASSPSTVAIRPKASAASDWRTMIRAYRVSAASLGVP